MNTPGSGSGFPGAGGRSARHLGGPGGRADDIEAALEQARVDQAAQQRRRDRWRRERGAQQVDVRSALSGAVDRTATLHLREGERTTGTVLAVGPDVVGLRTSSGARPVWVALAAVVAVELDLAPTGAAAVPAAELTSGPTLVEVLEQLREDGRDVIVLLTGGTQLSGEVTAVGDALTLFDAARRRHAVVALDAVVRVG